MTHSLARAAVALVLGALLIGLTGCAAGEASPSASHEEATVSVAKGRIAPATDCAMELDFCYTQVCQQMQPSPTEQCFKNCTMEFYACLEVPELEMSAD